MAPKIDTLKWRNFFGFLETVFPDMKTFYDDKQVSFWSIKIWYMHEMNRRILMTSKEYTTLIRRLRFYANIDIYSYISKVSSIFGMMFFHRRISINFDIHMAVGVQTRSRCGSARINFTELCVCIYWSFFHKTIDGKSSSSTRASIWRNQSKIIGNPAPITTSCQLKFVSNGDCY